MPVAFVCYRQGTAIDSAEMFEHLKTSVAKYKLPAKIIAVEELPKNPVGKIDKLALRKRLVETSV